MKFRELNSVTLEEMPS